MEKESTNARKSRAITERCSSIGDMWSHEHSEVDREGFLERK